MDCDKCGAEVPEAADACPECGEATAASDAGTGAVDETEAVTGTEPSAKTDEYGEPVPEDEQATDVSSGDGFFASDAAVVPADDVPTEPEPFDFEGESAGSEKPGALNTRAAMMALAVVLVLVALGAVAFLVPFGGTTLVQRLMGGNDPGAVAAKMVTAIGKYDMKGLLESTNSGSLPAADAKQYESQAAVAKTTAGGKDGVKNVKVVKVTIDPKDSTKATVDISADWLDDPAAGTYKNRTETLPMIQQNGKWVVQLF